MICQRQDYYNTLVCVISCRVSLWRLMANYSFVLRQRTCSCLLKLHHNPECVWISGIIWHQSSRETDVNAGDTLDMDIAGGLTFLSFVFFSLRDHCHSKNCYVCCDWEDVLIKSTMCCFFTFQVIFGKLSWWRRKKTEMCHFQKIINFKMARVTLLHTHRTCHTNHISCCISWLVGWSNLPVFLPAITNDHSICRKHWVSITLLIQCNHDSF